MYFDFQQIYILLSCLRFIVQYSHSISLPARQIICRFVINKPPPSPTRVAIEILFRKNSAEQTRNGFRYSADKSAHSAEFRVHQKSQFRSSEQNETKWNSAETIKFYETANKSRRFSSVFCFKNGLEQIFRYLMKMVQNGIPSFFFFRKWLGTEFRSFLF